MCDMGRYQGLQNPCVAKMPQWGTGSGEIGEGLGQNGNKPGLSQTNWDNCSLGLVSLSVAEGRLQTQNNSAFFLYKLHASYLLPTCCAAGLPSSGPFYLEAALSFQHPGNIWVGSPKVGLIQPANLSLANPLPSCVHGENVWGNQINVFN